MSQKISTRNSLLFFKREKKKNISDNFIVPVQERVTLAKHTFGYIHLSFQIQYSSRINHIFW